MSATVAETVWYQEDSLSPLTVSKPASFGVGQMLVVVIVQHNNPSAQTDLTTPSGWTFQGALDGTLVDGKVFSYVYTGSDPATWDFPYKSTADVVAGLFRITGADVATPTLVVSTTPATVSSPMDSPSVTPTGTDDLLLALISDICNGTILAATFPSGMTDLGLGEVTGHFMSSRAAYQQLSSGSATGVRTWTSVSPTGVEGGTWTVAVKSAASVALATPGPAVNTPTVRPAPTTPILLRSTLQDPPVLTTRQPIVMPIPAPPTRPGSIALYRSTLADPTPLTTPGPLILASTPRPAPAVVLVLRSSLVDAVLVTAATPQPLIVAAAAPRPATSALVLRGTLADPPVLTTPAPIVVAAPAPPTAGVVALLRSSLVDVIAPTAATPQPLVVGPGAQPATVTPAYLGRSTLADPPILTTSQPYVISQPTRVVPGAVMVLRSSLADAAVAGGQTPGPLVVWPAYKPTPAPPVLLFRSTLADPTPLTTPGPYISTMPAPLQRGQSMLLRGTLADPIVVTGVSTPQPIVLTTHQRRHAGRVLLVAAPVTAACDCITHRPNAGTTTRGSTGTTTRPFTGTTARPCSC